MKLAALFSGGKDSTYAILRAREMGHEVTCLLTMHPVADDSQLFHYPNSRLVPYLAESMHFPLAEYAVGGNTRDHETDALEQGLKLARTRHAFDGVVYGGISSRFQKVAFENVCSRSGLSPVAPLWNAEPAKYMRELLEREFKIMIVSVSAMGLGAEWLGRILDDESMAELSRLSKKNSFNLNFEGGEAETLVVDCPLFTKRLAINRAEPRWDGQRGIFEIREASLVEK